MSGLAASRGLMQILGTISDGTVSLARPQPMSAAISASAPRLGRTSLIRTVGGRLEDVLLLMLAVFLLPVAILLIGTPIMLCGRLAFGIVRRCSRQSFRA
jgi:hypothetical protein